MKSVSMAIAALVLAASVSAFAQAPKSPPPTALTSIQATHEHASGQIVSAVAVADPVFGVHANVLGLERRVEMLQWRKFALPAPAHYERAWSVERIDSSSFDAAHRNSGDLPFNGERWWSADPQLDGHPVSANVMSELDAWTPLKPDLSQLPTNLAVSFQPDGDWLSTSQDPAHPQVGDVRVRWRVIANAHAPAGSVLIAGRWELPAKVAAASPSSMRSQPAPTASVSVARAWTQRMFGSCLAWLIAGGLALGLLLLVWKRRR